MNEARPAPLPSELDDAALVREIVTLKGLIRSLYMRRDIMEEEVRRRLGADRKMLPDNDYDVRLQEDEVAYSLDLPAALEGLVTSEERARIVVPEHMEPVPARVNGTVVRSLRKYGESVSKIIDAHRTVGRTYVKIEEKKKVRTA